MTDLNQVSSKACPQVLTHIAQEELDIPTLIARHNDRLDFYDVSVWSVEAALQQAYVAGYNAGQRHPT